MSLTKSINYINNTNAFSKLQRLITCVLKENLGFCNHQKRNYCLTKPNLPKDSEKCVLSRNDVTNLQQNYLPSSCNNLLQGSDLQNSPSIELRIENVSDYAPATVPSYNLAAYANDSPLIQEFVKLGVKLYKFEKNKEIAEFILRLDFEKNVKEYIKFLCDNGVKADELGDFISSNPLIFKEDLPNLQIRLNYLQSKKFTSDMISVIIAKNPKWLSFNTREIDSRLGYFQHEFHLNGYEVRDIAVRQPKLITFDPKHVKLSVFSFKEEMGFNSIEMKKIIFRRPKLLMKCTRFTVEKFDYVHNVMKISHELLIDQLDILFSRLFRIKERHEYLKSLGRAQYNPKEPGYVSPKALVNGNDADFCKDIAKTSIQTFNTFLKTR